MLDDPSNLTSDRVALALAQILDLLGEALAVEATVGNGQGAQHLRLMPGPGEEIILVAGSVRHRRARSSTGGGVEDRQGERLGARDDRVDAAPFVVAMGVAADRPGRAQGRRAERRGEAAVGRTAGRFALDPEAETGGGPRIAFEQIAARLVLFERQEIALAQDAALAARKFAAAADLAHLAQDLFHDVEGREAHIDGGGGARRDGIDRGAAADEADIDRGA